MHSRLSNSTSPKTRILENFVCSARRWKIPHVPRVQPADGEAQNDGLPIAVQRAFPLSEGVVTCKTFDLSAISLAPVLELLDQEAPSNVFLFRDVRPLPCERF